jgi:hypothetical protein
MPAELSESFVNPYPGNRQSEQDSQYFNAKKEMERPQPEPEPKPEVSIEPKPEPRPEPKPEVVCNDGICKIKKESIFTKVKSKFGSSSSSGKKVFSFIIILILIILGYFGFKKIFDNVNEL